MKRKLWDRSDLVFLVLVLTLLFTIMGLLVVADAGTVAPGRLVNFRGTKVPGKPRSFVLGHPRGHKRHLKRLSGRIRPVRL